VAEIGDRIEAAHVLLLQEIDGIAFALGKQRDQHIGAGHLILAGRLDVEDRPLDHALEAAGGRGVRVAVDLEAIQFGIEIVGDGIGQLAHVDPAGLHHAGGVFVINQREEQMLQRRIFMMALGGVAQRIMQRGFKGGGKGWHICSPGTRRVCLSPLCRRTRTGVQVPDRTLFPFWPIPAGGAKGGNAQSFSE
jgi:hypothetical protein